VYYSSAEDTGFYKLRSHWGEEWGVAGYVSLNYGSDVCGIATQPVYVDTSSKDRKRALRASSKL